MAANAEALQRLETRAIGAEKLIQLLKTQISQIRSSSQQQGGGGSNEAAEIAALKAENEKLKKDIQAIFHLSWSDKINLSLNWAAIKGALREKGESTRALIGQEFI